MLICSVAGIGAFHMSEMAARFSISENNVSTSSDGNLGSIDTTTCCVMALSITYNFRKHFNPLRVFILD